MRFFISQPDALMAIDNVAVSMSSSSLGPTVKYVIFNENGSGFIEPASGVALRTPFSDPSPYQPLINTWITTLASATPAITLAQAQAIKSELVAAIYAVKRQANVSVTLSTGAKVLDGSDQAVAEYAVLASLAATSELNTIIAQLNSTNADGNAMVATQNNNVAEYNATDAILVSSFGFASQPMTNVVGFPGALSTLRAPAAIQLVPVGATSAITLTNDDVQILINAVQAQRENEQAVNATKLAAIAALSTIAAVIAYDATTGW